MADIVAVIMLIAMAVFASAYMMIRLIRANPEREALVRKLTRDRNTLARLVSSIYEECSGRQDVDPLAKLVAGQVEELYGTELTRQRLRELAGEKGAYHT